MAIDQIDGLRIATPCPSSWEQMAGDARVRNCSLCNLNVYNVSEMTRDEVGELLARTEGRLCIRLYRRADGTVLTRDCPTGLRALRRRASRAVAALITAILSLPVFATGGVCKPPRTRTNSSGITLTSETVTATQPAKLSGVVVLDGNPLPGVTLTIHDEATGSEVRVFDAVTDVDGAFSFANLGDGFYRVEARMESCKTASIEHLQLKEGQVTAARITMQLDTAGELGIMMGAVPPISIESHSATYSQNFMDNLPH